MDICRAQETSLFCKHTTLHGIQGVYRFLDRIEFAEVDVYELLKFVKCKDNKFYISTGSK